MFYGDIYRSSMYVIVTSFISSSGKKDGFVWQMMLLVREEIGFVLKTVTPHSVGHVLMKHHTQQVRTISKDCDTFAWLIRCHQYHNPHTFILFCVPCPCTHAK